MYCINMELCCPHLNAVRRWNKHINQSSEPNNKHVQQTWMKQKKTWKYTAVAAQNCSNCKLLCSNIVVFELCLLSAFRFPVLEQPRTCVKWMPNKTPGPLQPEVLGRITRPRLRLLLQQYTVPMVRTQYLQDNLH